MLSNVIQEFAQFCWIRNLPIRSCANNSQMNIIR